MNKNCLHRKWSFAALLLVFFLNSEAVALDLSSSNQLNTQQASTQADFIVVVVNSEPVTNNELRREMQRLLQQLAMQRRQPPDMQTLANEVLESQILQRLQLQLARETGIRVENTAIDQAEQNIALQNQIDVSELRRRVERDGLTVTQFRDKLRDQISIQRLREREIEPRVRVSETEIDQYLQEQQSATDIANLQLNLAQILVAVPESASVEQVKALRDKAQRALERARAGDDFSALVREFSDANNMGHGGQMGLRPAERYPDLFVQATAQLPVNGVSEIVRSPAGFHVLKVVEKINSAAITTAVTQTRVRHILLIPSAKLSEEQAKQTLMDYKRRVFQGQVEFAELAKAHSKDGSASRGGDLGWAEPGMFVPEFEESMNRLAPGEVSDPLVSRFGVHLIQVLERRTAQLTEAQQREGAKALLREKKLDEAYRIWAQELRSRGYVEFREPPQ